MAGSDASLARVLGKMKAAVNQVTGAAQRQLATEAHDLAAAIRTAAHERTGATKMSVEAVETAPGEWAVIAGGEATTKKVRVKVKDKDFEKARHTGGYKGEFDYVRAEEFGHRTEDGRHVPGSPFFFTTYRARRAGIRKRIADQALKAASDADLT